MLSDRLIYDVLLNEHINKSQRLCVSLLASCSIIIHALHIDAYELLIALHYAILCNKNT